MQEILSITPMVYQLYMQKGACWLSITINVSNITLFYNYYCIFFLTILNLSTTSIHTVSDMFTIIIIASRPMKQYRQRFLQPYIPMGLLCWAILHKGNRL